MAVDVAKLLTSPKLPQGFLDRIKQRLIYLVVAGALEFVAYKWPTLPLPAPQTITDWALALLATHGIGDVIKLIKEYIQTIIQQKKSQ